MKVTPYGNRVLVKAIYEDYSKTEGGIVLPQETQEQEKRKQTYTKGEVLALPKNAKTLTSTEQKVPSVKVGEIILFNTALARDINFEDQFIVHDDFIEGIVDK